MKFLHGRFKISFDFNGWTFCNPVNPNMRIPIYLFENSTLNIEQYSNYPPWPELLATW